MTFTPGFVDIFVRRVLLVGLLLFLAVYIIVFVGSVIESYPDYMCFDGFMSPYYPCDWFKFIPNQFLSLSFSSIFLIASLSVPIIALSLVGGFALAVIKMRKMQSQ